METEWCKKYPVHTQGYLSSQSPCVLFAMTPIITHATHLFPKSPRFWTSNIYVNMHVDQFSSCTWTSACTARATREIWASLLLPVENSPLPFGFVLKDLAVPTCILLRNTCSCSRPHRKRQASLPAGAAAGAPIRWPATPLCINRTQPEHGGVYTGVFFNWRKQEEGNNLHSTKGTFSFRSFPFLYKLGGTPC